MILAMGLYQGLNPPMGWLAAVGRGLETRSGRAVLVSTATHAAGHYCAMAAVLVPAAVLLAVSGLEPVAFLPWLGAVLVGFGLFKLHRPAHPRFLVRLRPRQRFRFSFLMALTHCGSPIMMLGPLVSVLMLLDAAGVAGRHAAARAFGFGLLALALSALMVLTLLAAASLIAWIVWRRLGLGALTRLWLDLDRLWALVFLLMGAMDLAMAAGGAAP
jgi:hypothetical protein